MNLNYIYCRQAIQFGAEKVCAHELYISNFEGEKNSRIFWTIFHKIGHRVVARTQKFVKGS